MTNNWIADHTSMFIWLQTAACLLAGILLGSFHFMTLRWNVRFLVRGRALLPLGLQLSRLAMLTVAFALVARAYGSLPLLAMAFGVVVARTMMLRWRMQS